jgi:hypothetical protein
MEIQFYSNEDPKFHWVQALEVKNIECNRENVKKKKNLENQLQRWLESSL